MVYSIVLKMFCTRNEHNTSTKQMVWYRIISSIVMLLCKCDDTFEYCYDKELGPRL